MKRLLPLILILAAQIPSAAEMSHDITSLSQWGPYSKTYHGISHISDLDSWSKVEFCLVPGQYRRSFKVPCALYETDVHPWFVTTDMKHITYRHEIEWKDRLFVDASYHIVDDRHVILESKCVNDTDKMQNINLQLAMSRTEETMKDGKPVVKIPAPEKLLTGSGDFLASYPGDATWYGVAWNYEYSQVREFLSTTLEGIMPYRVADHVRTVIKGDKGGHYTANFLRPVTLRPHSDTTVFQLIVCGDKDYVSQECARFHADEAAFTSRIEVRDNRPEYLPQSGDYALGERLLEATLLTNIVYPVSVFGNPIRHFCPGKHWNSLYTWDCGFIGWGMSRIDPMRGYEIIRQYTTGPSEPEAFVHHGTPLAIQILALGDVWSALGGHDDVLNEIYPRLKRFYSHMVSTYSKPSGLMATWDLFYNSGGWDDYPPQLYYKYRKPERALQSPVVTTAYYIRCARILRMAAVHLGLKQDVKQYDADIKRMSEALLGNAWDEESGYFGYVVHDVDGHPVGLLRSEDGSNFNMGLDGVTPLVAGIGSEAQTARMLSHVFTKGELWSDCGISAVDQSAPYYRVDGYWNGTVWMPHQMILWKTMLDLGLADRARQIAFKAMEKWNEECSDSYNCYEHFMIETGRGGGWLNFSGLSSPLVNWFCAYFKPGTVSTGFNVLLSGVECNADNSALSATMEFDSKSGKQASVLVCLNPSHKYKVYVNGREILSESPYAGFLEFGLTPSKKPVKLQVLPV